MDIERLDPEDTAAMTAFWELNAAVSDHDRPGFPPPRRRSVEAHIADRRLDLRQEYHLARVDGRVSGYVWLSSPMRDDTSVMYAHVAVHPQHRRHGIGSHLLDLALRRGVEQRRSTVIGRATEPLPGGPHRDTGGRDFLRGKGFAVTRASRGWRVDLAEIDGKLETDLFDESLPHAWEYELIGWSGPTPAQLLAAVAALTAGFGSRVRLGDPVPDVEHPDVERQRAAEALDARCGVTRAASYARHTATGDLVGYSQITASDDSPAHAFQTATLVQPEHRGHRLGTLLKIDAHRRLRRAFPAARTLWTSVAEGDTHLLAINERLGFTEVDRQLDFQRTI